MTQYGHLKVKENTELTVYNMSDSAKCGPFSDVQLYLKHSLYIVDTFIMHS